jgi:hypothetical protein
VFDTDEPLETIFAMKEGDISPVFPSGGSWIFYRCDADPIDPDLEDEELLLEIANYVLANEKGIVEAHFMQEAEEFKFRAEAGSFADAALEEGFYPPIQTEYFPINYGDVFAARPVRVVGEEQVYLESASTNESFFEEAFSVEVGGITDPILLSDRIVVLKVMDEREISEEEWENIEVSLEYLPLATLDSDLPALVIERDKLVDNFMAMFSQMFPRQ